MEKYNDNLSSSKEAKTLKTSILKLNVTINETQDILELSDLLVKKFFNPENNPSSIDSSNHVIEAKKTPNNIVEVFDDINIKLITNIKNIRLNLEKVLSLID